MLTNELINEIAFLLKEKPHGQVATILDSLNIQLEILEQTKECSLPELID